MKSALIDQYCEYPQTPSFPTGNGLGEEGLYSESCNSEGMKAVNSSGFAATSPYTDTPELAPEYLYYFNARWYDPQLGRFITEDPVKDGVNFYAYAYNNPL